MHFSPWQCNLGIPIVDADAMGRAYPEAQMTSFAIGSLQPWPLALVTLVVWAVVTHVPTWKWMERASRVLTIETGSMAATCKAPRTGAEIKQWSVVNSMSFAIYLGSEVRKARAQLEDPIQAICAAAKASILFTGKVVDVDRKLLAGFEGVALLDGLDEYAGSEARLEFQNEWLIRRDGDVVATVPHLICLLDATSGEAIGTETARYGQRVVLIGITAPPLFRSEEGLKYVGPRSMGYELDPTDPCQ